MTMRERRLAARDDVAQPHLERLDAELLGDDVDQPLAREHLGGPRPPVGDVRGLVGDGRR